MGEGFEAVVGDHAREMECVALRVKVSFKRGGVVAAEVERGGSEPEARSTLRRWLGIAATLTGVWRVDGGTQEDVSGDEGGGSCRGSCEAGVAKGEISLPSAVVGEAACEASSRLEIVWHMRAGDTEPGDESRGGDS